MMKRLSIPLLIILVFVLVGCGALGGDDATQAADEGSAAGAAPTATSTPLALAPTLAGDTAPTPTQAVDEPENGDGEGESPAEEPSGGPTPLPEPTQIGAPTATPEDSEEEEAEGEATEAPVVNTGSTGPGITIAPQLGEPLDVVVVNGSGFEPNEEVTFHWGKPNGKTGPEYWSMETDDNGNFQVGLKVLPADRWPGGPPEERDLLQLRVFAESLGEDYYFANFTYIPRVNSITSLVQTYTNDEYGYSISIPNLWTWSWVEDDTTDVRFDSPNAGTGFVRVEAGTNVSGLISTVMAQEFSGQNYTTRSISAGKYPGTEALLDSGRVVQFIPSDGQTYILSFINDNGKYDTNIHGSFTLN
jgi:hypothetical protein